MSRKYLINASLFGTLSVALGAFGAHALEQLTTDEKILRGFQTGVYYQMYHSLALLAVGILIQRHPNRWLKWAGICFITGILLFSGSLYFLTFLKIQGGMGIKLVGPITPLGGLFFIAGWLFLLLGVSRKDV